GLGKRTERPGWGMNARGRELRALLDPRTTLARPSRLNPPARLAYANPTNRRATPDREVGPLPAIRGDSGEVWARMTVNEAGSVIPGSGMILWASRQDLGDAVLRVISGFRYRRKESRTGGLVVYQRFRVKGG